MDTCLPNRVPAELEGVRWGQDSLLKGSSNGHQSMTVVNVKNKYKLDTEHTVHSVH